jgi:FKBP-type peptidyl-prolyl cis-trans isomerase SlyD
VPTHPPDAAAVKPGDLLLLDYELWAVGPSQNELIATTEESVATAAHSEVPEGYEFGPRPHLVGGDQFPKGIEQAISSMHVDEKVERDFPPAEAYGERDPKLIELLSMHEVSRLPEMRKDDAHLDVGTILTVRGRRGRVASLTAARVRVDFNPPFSGKTIRAKFHVVRPIDDPADKVRALIDLVYGRAKEFGIEVHGNTVSVTIPDRTKFDLGWFAAKSRLIERIRSQLKPKAIRFVEEYETPPQKEESTKAASAKPSSAKAKSGEAEPVGASEAEAKTPTPIEAKGHAPSSPA